MVLPEYPLAGLQAWFCVMDRKRRKLAGAGENPPALVSAGALFLSFARLAACGLR